MNATTVAVSTLQQTVARALTNRPTPGPGTRVPGPSRWEGAAVAVPVTLETVTGRVVSVDPKGLKLDGHADWFDFSRFANDLVPPMRDQHVILTLARQGFVRKIPAGVTARTDETPCVDCTYGVPPTAKTDETASVVTRAKDRPITRLAVLKAAAFRTASRPQFIEW